MPESNGGKKGFFLIEITMMVVAVGALILNYLAMQRVGTQIEQTNHTIRSSTIEQIYSRMHDINRLFLDHPELKPYFYKNMAVGDPNPLIQELGLNEKLVHAKVDPLAEMLCDFFTQALIELKYLPPEAYEGWQNYIMHVYRNSPAIREYYRANHEWYYYADADKLFDKVDKELAARDKQMKP